MYSFLSLSAYELVLITVRPRPINKQTNKTVRHMNKKESRGAPYFAKWRARLDFDAVKSDEGTVWIHTRVT